MTASIKNAVLLTGCVIVLSLVLFCVRFLPEKTSLENNETDIQSINILNQDIKNINSIDIINDYGEYSFIKKDEKSFEIKDFDKYQRNENLYDELREKVCNLVAERSFNTEDTSVDIYGFTEPLAQVFIKYNNLETKLLIGNIAPGNIGYYVTIQDKPTVYLVSKDICSVFLRSKIDYISLNIVSRESNKDLEYLEILNSKTDKKIKIIKKNNKYNIVEPGNKKIDDSKTDMIDSLENISAQKVETIKVSQEDIKNFGFDDPFVNLNLKYKNKKIINILVSKITDSEDFFVFKKDSDIIYRVSKDSLKLDEFEKLVIEN